MDFKIYHGDCLAQLKKLKTNSIDSLVTDPPAGISFMGKSWDQDKGGRKQWIAWMTEVMQECLRVLKPGAHGLVWAIPRTSHWTATALEDAGFEVRDVVTHIFGSGFPKSLDVSKAIDKAAGAKREVVERRYKNGDMRGPHHFGNHDQSGKKTECNITTPSTPEAKQWQGFGTALKPASEHWVLVRKPLSEKTVAANVLKHGTGGLNIDASRIDGKPRATHGDKNIRTQDNLNGRYSGGMPLGEYPVATGRFPANLVLNCCGNDPHDPECSVAELDRQSGTLKSGARKPTENSGGNGWKNSCKQTVNEFASDSGGASRFFYCAKASRADKNAGCEGFPEKEGVRHLDGGEWKVNKTARSGEQKRLPAANNHPTVKSTKLMSYLIRMITPPGGTCLDPFLGSGSTGVSALKEGFQFVGIEKEQEYFEIAKARIQSAK